MNELPLRKFGLMFAVVFALLAAWLRTVPWVLPALGSISLLFLAASLLRPSALSRPARAWMRLGEALHRVVSPVVLGSMYILLVVPTGLLRRLLGGDPLKRRYDAAAPTYWSACEPRSRRLDDFRQQF